MKDMAHTTITRASDQTDAHAFITEVVATWIAFHLDNEAMTDVAIMTRLDKCGLANFRHDGTEYRVSISGISGQAASLRGALRDWILTRNKQEAS